MRFQPGDGPSRGLLRDCENRLWNRWSITQHYSAPPPTRGGADLWEMGRVKLSFVICFTHSAASQHSQSGPRLDRDMNQRMDGDEAENGEMLNLIPILILAGFENVSPWCD